MASSYWESTQRKFWTFTKQELAHERKKIEESERNLVNMYPLPDRRHLSIYFYHRTFSVLTKMTRSDQYRIIQDGTTTGHTATGSRYRTGLCASVLR